MSIIAQAKTELAAINFGNDDSRVMIEILEKFFDQWDSGGAVSGAAPILQRLIAGKPLSPLTGEDSEWFIHDMEGCYAQNKRSSTIFKDKDGLAYDIDRPGRPAITFPYWPDRAEVSSPVIEISTIGGEWRPIETAPRGADDFFLVCSVEDKRSPFAMRGDILWSARKPDTPSHLHLHYLTHWMPLPAKPM